MEFANKEYFLLLLLLIPYLLWYFLFRRKTEPTMRISDTNAYRYAPKSWRMWLLHVPMVLRMLTFTLIVTAMARPQVHNSLETKTVEGIDIMISMDVSTSMLLQDISPNRLEAAKKTAAEFVAKRENDNIGLTIFAGEAFTQCPMTVEHSTLLTLLHNVRTDIAASGLIEDGTAIGMGLATSLTKLQNSKAKSRVVILLTDGTNNMGDISPATAAEMAKSMGVRVYTIAVGTDKVTTMPNIVAGTVQYVPIKSEIDERALKEIAATTNGNFYRATNSDDLRRIYNDIDKLEKSKLYEKIQSETHEGYQPFVIAAIIALLLEMLLRITILRRLP